MRQALQVFASAIGSIGLWCANGQVQVRVVDSQGLSISGARVEARGKDRRVPARVAATGADGAAELPVQPPLELAVAAPGFDPVRQAIAPGLAMPVTIRLRPAIVRSSIDVVVRDAPDGVTAVGSALEIERTGARTVFDAVERVVPGVSVTRRGVMGYGISTNGTGGVTIRGIGESPNTGVLIVVDGRPDFQGLMGHPLPDFYSLSDAGSVSVTEGPASVLYGSNALGGVVEVKNWAPPEGVSTQLTTSFGSFNTGQYRLSHGARFERSFYSVNAGVSHTGGDRPSSAFRDQDGTVTAGYDLSSVWKASINGRYGHFHVEDPGPITAPLSNSYARVGRGGFSANLDNATANTWGYMRVYSSYGNHYITDGFRSTDRTTGVRVDQCVAIAPKLTLDVGGDVVNYGGQARNKLSSLDYGSHNLSSAAEFVRAQWTASRRLRLHTGVRYEYNSLFGSTTVPEFGVAVTLRDGYSLSAEVSRGFRNPTIRELYLFPAPNPALLPEHMWNYQATFQAHPARSLTASVTGYYADLDNLIVATGRYPNLKLLNAGAALNRGIETTSRWTAHRRVALQGGYAYLRSTNLAPYVPGHKFNYGVDLNAGRAFVYFGGMSVGARWADSQHNAKLGAYTITSLKLTVPLNRQWRLTAAVDNLLHETYQVVTGYPMPGVNAAAGFTVSF
jgi:outer membrane receptor protein involved in Fe transport